MIEKMKSRPAYILISLAVFAIAANFVFGLFVSRQEREIASYEMKVEELRAMSSPRHGGGAAAAVRIKEFREELPDGDELASILNEVFDSAGRNGIRIPSGSYNPAPSKDGRASRYVFTLPVEGRYADLKRFLYELESSARPLMVEDITLTGSRAGESGIGLGIRMSVYYR